MKELTRTFSHGSEICQFLERDASGNVNRFIKVASTFAGIIYIKNEKEGLDWYIQRYTHFKDLVLNYVFQPEKEYARIEMKYVDGKKPDYRKGLTKNVEAMNRIIEHYLSVWPKNENSLYPIHGDLSLDNVIFQNEKILICDWEHFAKHVALWGFDILYLIFETLWFEIREKMPNKRVLTLLTNFIKRIDNNGVLNEEQRKAPLQTTKNFIKDNLFLWGSQLQQNLYKLPVLFYTDRQVDFIDKSILNLY